MTTVAYKSGVLAFDSQVTDRNRVVGHMVKGRKIGGLLIGGAGNLALVTRFIDWIVTGASGYPPPMAGPNDAAGEGLIVMPCSLLITVAPSGLDHMRSPFHAIGSGADIAIGAMAQGATAEQAVRIAAALDVYTGGTITALTRDAA